jgi:hypothetical protein
VSLESVVLRSLVALFGTLVFSVALATAIGHPERMILDWELSFAFVWVTWVWLPERTTSKTRWWLTRIAGYVAVLLALYSLAYVLSSPA